jgi:hypothetical protein
MHVYQYGSVGLGVEPSELVAHHEVKIQALQLMYMHW